MFVERLWKSVKYEMVSRHAYDSVTEARQSIMQYLDWYNRARPPSSLDRHTPDEAYAVMLPTGKLAAYVAAETPLKNLGRLFKRMGPLLPMCAGCTRSRNVTRQAESDAAAQWVDIAVHASQIRNRRSEDGSRRRRI